MWSLLCHYCLPLMLHAWIFIFSSIFCVSDSAYASGFYRNDNFLPYGTNEGDLNVDIGVVAQRGNARNNDDVCYKEYSDKAVFIGNLDSQLRWSIEICPATPSVGIDTVIPLAIEGLKMVSGTLYKRTVVSSSQVQDLIWRTTKDKVFQADWSLILTWVNATWGQAGVVPKPGTTSFQAVLTTDHKRNTTFVVLAYGSLDAGLELNDRASALINIGGSPFTIPGSGTHDFRQQALRFSNVAVPGLWIVKANEEGRTVSFHNPNPPKMHCSPSKSEYELCPDEAFSIDFRCELQHTDNNNNTVPPPLYTVEIHGLARGIIRPIYSFPRENSHIFQLSFFPEITGTREITFVGKSLLDGNVVAEIKELLNVVVPPHSPFISVNGLIIEDNDVIETRPGQRLHVTCDVANAGSAGSILGKLSLVSDDPLTIDNKQQKQQQQQRQSTSDTHDNADRSGDEDGQEENTSTTSSSISVSLLATHNKHGMSCVCQLRGCYRESTKFTIHVFS